VLYPLKFQPIYKSAIWGGRNLEIKFKRSLPFDKVAESWEVCCRENGMSIVANGTFKGMSLCQLIQSLETKLIGDHVYNTSFYNAFPLLIKIIDANDKLSVQVHPDDEYAKKKCLESGKTEMWYIIDAKPGAKLIYGLKQGVSKDKFIESLKSSHLEDVLNEVEVKPGDALYIPSGTIHAILDGLLIAEIQQNSDTTYRVYDWNRVDASGRPRELHIKEALEVINFHDEKIDNKLKNKPVVLNYGSYCIRELCRNTYFAVEELIVNGEYDHSTESSKFFIYTSIEGEGIIKYKGGVEHICSGETLFIPAYLGNYSISGHMKLLRTHL